MNVLAFEAKKLLKNRGLTVFIALLMIANLILGCVIKTEEKNETYSAEFTNETDNIIYGAEINYFLIQDKNSEEAQYQVKIINKYTELLGLDVSNTTKGYATVLVSPFPYVSALLITLFVAIILANNEYTSSLVLLSYKKTRTKICGGKIGLLVLTSLTTLICCVLSMLIGSAIINGMCGLLEPIQSIPEYIHSPYNINILTAIILRVILSIGMMLILALTVFVITIIVKRIIFSILGTGLLIGFDYLLMMINNGRFTWNNNINIHSFITDAWLVQYRGKQLICFVSQIQIFTVFIVVGGIALSVISCILFRYTRLINVVKNKDNTTHQRCKNHTAISYEVAKLIQGKAMVVVIILFLANLLWIHCTNVEPYRDWDQVYKYSLSQMLEMSYEEQQQYSDNTKSEAYQTIVNAQDMREKYYNGEIEYESYVDAQQKAGAAELQISVFETIDEQLETVGKLRDDGIDAVLVYSTGWIKLFESNGDFILLLALVLVIVPYMTIENESKYSMILSSKFLCNNKLKQKFNARKILVATICSSLLILIFNVSELILLHIEYGLPSCDSYAAGAGVTFVAQNLKLIDAVIIKLLLSLVASIALILVIQILNQSVKKTLPIITIIITWGIMAFSVSSLCQVWVAVNIVSWFSYKALLHPSLWSFVRIGCVFLSIIIIYVISQRKKITYAFTQNHRNSSSKVV